MTPQEINEAVARKLGMNFFVDTTKDCEAMVPDYCHDIAAAWEIVDYIALNSKDILLRFRIEKYKNLTKAGWYTEAGGMGGDFTISEDQNEVLPMAIVNAFLKL